MKIQCLVVNSIEITYMKRDAILKSFGKIIIIGNEDSIPCFDELQEHLGRDERVMLDQLREHLRRKACVEHERRVPL